MGTVHKLKLTGLLLAGAVAMTGNQALAGGFSIREQSASGLGMAFAGAAAGYDDLSSMFFNPATMIRNKGFNAQAEASVIIPSSKISVTSPAGGPDSGNIGKVAVVPSTYVAYSVNPDFVFGVGINAPFGLETEANAGWGGAPHGIKSEMKVLNINPMVAYRISPMLSVGAGLQMDYMEVTLTSNVGIPVTIKGKDKASFGFTAGVLFEPMQGTRVGIGYRSKINHKLKGNMTTIRTIPVTADFTAPESVTASFHQDINPQWAIKGSVEWMNWSRFENLTIKNLAGTTVGNTVENWKDSWFFSGGVEFKPTPTMVLRAGAAYEKSPVPDATRTPRIPDNDRIWLTVGGGMKVTERISINASYAHIFVKKAPINLDTGLATELIGTTKTHLDIFSVSAKIHF